VNVDVEHTIITPERIAEPLDVTLPRIVPKVPVTVNVPTKVVTPAVTVDVIAVGVAVSPDPRIGSTE
jgi:hypothetical protein